MPNLSIDKVRSMCLAADRLNVTCTCLSGDRMYCVDYRELPIAYRLTTLRETISRASNLISETERANCQLSDCFRIYGVDNDGQREELSPDIFSDDVMNLVDRVAYLQDSCQRLLAETEENLVRVSVGEDLVDPHEIFDSAMAKDLIRATYVLDCRATVCVLLRDSLTRLIDLVCKVLTSILGVTINEDHMEIHDCKRDGVISLKIHSSRVYYTPEEIEERNALEKRRLLEEKARVEMSARLSRVGDFIKELHDDLIGDKVSSICKNPDVSKALAKVLPLTDFEELYACPSEDTARFLDVFKRFLCDISKTDSVSDGLCVLGTSLAKLDTGEYRYWAFKCDWMTPEDFNYMIKFFWNKGYSPISMLTMAEMSGDLQATEKAFSEPIVLTTP